MAWDLRSTIDKWDFMKLERFCKAKDIVSRTKWQPTDWGKKKKRKNSTSNRGLIATIYNELKKLDNNNSNNLIKEWGTELIREFSTEESPMMKKHLKKCSASLFTKEMQIKTTLRLLLETAA